VRLDPDEQTVGSDGAASPKFMDATIVYLLKQIRNAGFTCRDESVNCTEATLARCPATVTRMCVSQKFTV